MSQQLCFRVSPEKVYFALIDNATKSIVQSDSLELKERTDDANKEAIKKALENKDLLSFDGEVSLAIVGKKVSLLPQNVFGESNAKAIFDLSFGKTEQDIDYNRFPELGMVNVFEIPSWIKSFFVLRYPRIIMHHEVTHLLRGIYKGSTFPTTVHISIETDFFFLAIVQQNKLLFFNSFDYKNEEDIIYHTLFVIEQKELTEMDLQFTWREMEEDSQLFNQFKTALNRIKPNSKLKHLPMESIKNQLFCV